MLRRLTRIFVGYESVPIDDHHHRRSHRIWSQMVPVVFASSLFMILGIVVGRSLSRPDNLTTHGLLCKLLPPPSNTLCLAECLFVLVPYGSIPETWHHNLTFSSKPTPESEVAWSSLIPGIVTNHGCSVITILTKWF